MPGGDRKGPMGEGPMTGRGLGLCAGNDTPGSVRDINQVRVCVAWARHGTWHGKRIPPWPGRGGWGFRFGGRDNII